MRRIITLSIAVLITIGGTIIALSESVKVNDHVQPTGIFPSLQKVAQRQSQLVVQPPAPGTPKEPGYLSPEARQAVQQQAKPNSNGRPPRPHYDPELEARSHQIFQSVGEEKERLLWLNDQENLKFNRDRNYTIRLRDETRP